MSPEACPLRMKLIVPRSIKSLAIKYELHPLSIEDMLHHGSSSSRSKADYYRQHLFVSAIVHRTLSAAHAEDDIYKPPTPSPFPSTLPSHDEEAFIGSASSLAASAHYSPKSHESYAAQLGIAFGVPPSRPGNLRTVCTLLSSARVSSRVVAAHTQHWRCLHSCVGGPTRASRPRYWARQLPNALTEFFCRA